MGLYYNGHKVRNLYFNGKCITRLALGKEMTRLVEGDDFVRAEWLCGRNGAFIDTMHPLSVFEDAFEIRARIADETAPNPDGGENDLFGVMSDDGRRCICFYARNSGRLFFAYSNILLNGNQIYFGDKNVFSAKMVADNSNFTVFCDGESKSATVGTFPQGVFGRSIALFQLTTTKTQNYFHGDIAYFRITDPTFSIDRVNMTPCRLLRPIPASLDANGIARNAGECGMYDTVSGKFYGNVANSGSFTVSDD